MRIFAVIRRRAGAWDFTRPMEEQPEWLPHAEFMTALEASGALLLAGPLEGDRDVLFVMCADDTTDIERLLAPDPWTRSGLLETTRVAGWTLRVGSLT